MELNLEISSTLGSDSVRINPNVTNIPDNSTLNNVRILLNEISDFSGFREIDIPFLDDNNTLLNSYLLKEPDVVKGKSYLMKLSYYYKNNNTSEITSADSNTISVTIKSVPIHPVADQIAIRPEDSGVSINISSQYTLNSTSDGYSTIDKMIVYIAKVNSKNAEDLFSETIELNNGYNNWYRNSTSLINGEDYEIAFRLVNNIGESTLSNTIIFKPSDLPSKILHLFAYNKFTDTNINSNNTNAGDLIFYWGRPDDFDRLQSENNGFLSVTSYEIYKQEMIYDEEENAHVPFGEAEKTVLPVPENGIPLYEIEETYIEEQRVDYRYIFAGSNDTNGKKFVFSVVAVNANGKGPESQSSNLVASYINPDAQPFDLVNETIDVGTNDNLIRLHTGKLSINVIELSHLNGSTDIIVEKDITGLSSGTSVNKSYGRTMFLTVETDSDSPNLLFRDEVTLKQLYTLETIRDDESGTTVTSATLLNKWKIELSDIIPNTNNSNESLNDLLVFGTKYRFTLERMSSDPIYGSTKLKSLPEVVVRTHFKSPDAVSQIQAYSITSSFVPVTLNDQPAVRVVFNQLTQSSLNGCDSFKTPIEYEVRLNSQSVAGISRIVHDENHNGPIEILVPSDIGIIKKLNVIVYCRNPEFDNLEIEGSESSQDVFAWAVGFPSAVTNISTVTTVDSLTVRWTKQSLVGLNGFTNTTLDNIVYLFDETEPNNPMHKIIVSYNTPPSDLQSADFNNLTNGHVYKVYIVATGKYTNLDITGSNYVFDEALIRQNYATTAVKIVGVPSEPTKVEAYAGSENVVFHYDPPYNLNGHNADELMFNFILNRDDQFFPYQDEERVILQQAVLTVIGSSDAVATTGYDTRAESNNRSNAGNLKSQTLYNYAIFVVSKVGGSNITNKSDNLPAENGTELSLVPLNEVPIKFITGEVFEGPSKLWLDNNVPKPNIEASSGEEHITLLIDKPSNTSNTPNELVVILDNNDLIGSNGSIIPNFDTRKVREIKGGTGLSQLETFITTEPVIDGVNYGPFTDLNSLPAYDFKVINQEGQQKYSIVFRNLVNGRPVNVVARFAKTFEDNDYFSESTSILIAAEAPPTTPLSPQFNVDSKTINLSWNVPENSGGAGLTNNSALLYEVRILNSDGNSTLATIDNISTTFLQINSTNFNMITDGTNYQIQIFAYYLKASSKVVSALAAVISQVRPNVPPVAPTVTTTRGNNSITVNITTAPSSTQNLYPLSEIQIFIKRSTDVSYPTNPAKTILADAGWSGSNVLEPVFLQNLVNGIKYIVRVVSVANYDYAQAPETQVSSELVPFGPPEVSVAENTVVGNNKAVVLTVKLNGSGNITQLIALGKSPNSNTIGIINKSGAGLPTIDLSGFETPLVAANNIATLTVDFMSSIPGRLFDAIIVVNTQNSTDAASFGNHFTS
jgi:hypothetical protein